jgi:hypothetical protein
MFIAEVISKGKRGKAYTSILLRESFRVGATVKSKTLAVLTHLPAHVLEAVRRAVAQPADSLPKLADASDGSLRLRQAESFGALWTVDQLAQQLGIKKALGVTQQAQLSYWQVLARVLRPGSSLLATVRLATTCAPPRSSVALHETTSAPARRLKVAAVIRPSGTLGPPSPRTNSFSTM